MSNYYIAKTGSLMPMGPMSIDEIRAGIQKGTITEDYLYCTEGMSQWLPIAQLPGLFPSLPNLPASSTYIKTPQPVATGPRPGSLMAWSVINTIFAIPFCWAYGITLFLALFALSNSKKVNKYIGMNNYTAARKCARRALAFNIWTSIVLIPVYSAIIYANMIY